LTTLSSLHNDFDSNGDRVAAEAKKVQIKKGQARLGPFFPFGNNSKRTQQRSKADPFSEFTWNSKLIDPFS
jgi:hypothetical protein